MIAIRLVPDPFPVPVLVKSMQKSPMSKDVRYDPDFVKTGLQFSLAIRGGYVPEKSQTANNKTGILGPN